MPLQQRRALLLGAGAAALGAATRSARAEQRSDDPLGSLQWPDLKREFFGDAPVLFDSRVRVSTPRYADDPMNVAVEVSAPALTNVRRFVVFVDRNPIRKVLEFQPTAALPSLSFRFKLEQASPVRAAALTPDGVWHVGQAYVEASGGGCTAPGDSRRDGSWAKTLGDVSARLFAHDAVPGREAPGPAADATRLRLRVMHPMDTGLVAGIPAFYLRDLLVRDAAGRELLRLQIFEPVSENPIFSFDLPGRPSGPLQVQGSDNNGNRISKRIEGRLFE
jgi:sulfur-oxidizing protein SoxY